MVKFVIRLPIVAAVVFVATLSNARADVMLGFSGSASDSTVAEFSAAYGFLANGVVGGSVLGTHTPAHNGAAMECIGCQFLFESPVAVSSTATERVFQGGDLSIHTVNGSTVDPGGCVDLNFDGNCYTWYDDIQRWRAEYQGTLFRGDIRSLTIHADGAVDGSAIVELDGAIAHAYGVPITPWYVQFTIDASASLFSTGSGDVSSIALQAQPVPEPSALVFFGISAVPLCLAAVRRSRKRTIPTHSLT